MDIRILKDALVRAAKEAGITEYELYYAESADLSAEALKDEISNFSSGASAGISFRCKVDGKMGYASTELLTEEEMTELVSRAAANARNIENEDEVFIFPGSPKYGTPNAKFSEPATAAEVRENVLSLQKQQYGASDMVTDGTKSGAFTGTTEIYLYNSYGLELSNRIGVSAAYVAPVLKNGEESDNDFDFAVGKTAAEMGDLAARTVGRVKEKFGAGSVESGKYNIVFDGESMRDLLATFFSGFSAKSAQMGLSRLAGKEGERVAADCVTITDDPMREGYPAQTSFDGEGVAAFRKNVIENGVLKTLLYDLTTAKKAGRESTGNGLRGSYTSSVNISPFCFCLEPGNKSEEQLFSAAGDGILITELNGLHAGADGVTGDFSLQSAGYRIRGGKKAEYVKGFTVAGNFYELLLGITAVGNKLKFGIPASVTAFAAPPVLVPGMSIAGK